MVQVVCPLGHTLDDTSWQSSANSLAVDAYSSGHLVPSLWDLHMFYLLGPILFPNLSSLFRTMLFEYPSVLSRFCLTADGRSLIYNKNSNGPSTVPCGTLDVNVLGAEDWSSSTTRFTRPMMKLDIQRCCHGVVDPAEVFCVAHCRTLCWNQGGCSRLVHRRLHSGQGHQWWVSAGLRSIASSENRVGTM